jgi:hypothetical protein
LRDKLQRRSVGEEPGESTRLANSATLMLARSFREIDLSKA